MEVVVGIGCDRGTPLATLEHALQLALSQGGVAPSAVVALATIDKKSDEVAILELAAHHGWPLQFYRAEELALVEVPSPSETVRKYMGTPAVAEAAALLAARTDMRDLLVEKLKYRGTDGKNATVSLAKRSEHE